MSVILKEKKNSSGSISLYLAIYDGPGSKRRFEFLNHLKLQKGTTHDVKSKNKSNRKLAEDIALERAHQLAASDYSLQTDQAKKVIVLAWMKGYVDKYKKKDFRNMSGVLGRFTDYLNSIDKSDLLMKDFNEMIVIGFRDELEMKCEGEGGKSYYARFRKIVKQAIREKVINFNPCLDVKPPQGEANKRDVLSFHELQILANTPTEATEVRRAFLFCSYTGLAWVDVKALKWENINSKENVISIVRSKLEKYNRKIEVPMNETAIELLGVTGKKKDAIFDLPTANGANKSLKLWVKRAEIDKHITWHCGRHGLGTSLIKNGTGIYETGNILGHASLKYTKRYLHDSREQNQKAIDSLPKIKL